MPRDSTLDIILQLVGGFLPVGFALMTFCYRESSWWIRSVSLAWSLASIAWCTLGLLPVFYAAHFTRAQRGLLAHWQPFIGGVALGLVIAALFSPDFWKVSRHYRGFRWLR
jgi:hypothetical protein